MGQKIVLGFSENVIALVLETLKDRGESGPFSIVQNIPVTGASSIPFLPSGFNVTVLRAWEGLELPADGGYLFGVGGAGIKQIVHGFFRENFNVRREQYINLFHRSSVTASSALFGKGCYMEPQSVVSPFARIGFGVTINRSVSIGHHSVVEDFATIQPGVQIAGHVKIGSGSQIGMGSTVFDHVSIGANTTIGGGSVVTRDIPDNVVAWGNPCKVIRNKVSE